MGIIMTDDTDRMREHAKKAGEALSAVRGALIAAENGSDAGAVKEILLDCTEIIATEIRGLRKIATDQPRQQELQQTDLRPTGGAPVAVVTPPPAPVPAPKQLPATAGKSS